MTLVLGTDWAAVADTPFGSAGNAFDLRYFGAGLAYHLFDKSYPGNWNLYWGPLRRSKDSGTSWTDLTNGTLGCAAYDVAPDGRLWAVWVNQDAGTTGQWYVYFSDDEGDTWTLSLSPGVNRPIVDIACHPTDANTVAVICAGNLLFGTTRSTRFTANHGTSWSSTATIPLLGGLSALTYWNPPPRLVITNTGAWLALDPNNAILRSTNLGTSWTTVKSSTSATISNTGALLRSGTSGPYFAYRTQGSGTPATVTPLYRSTDDGATWTELSFPVGVIDVRAMAYDADTDVLVIVTDTTNGSADQNYWLATAGVVGAGLEAWTEIANAPYEAIGDDAFYSSTRWTINTLAVVGADLYVATNWDYERLSLVVVPPPNPGGGGGPPLPEPFKRRLIERFPRPELFANERTKIARFPGPETQGNARTKLERF